MRVIGRDPELEPIRGELGVVVGRGEDPTHPGYAVWIYSAERVWSVEEDEIEATGRVDPAEPAPFAVRVAVNERGEGHLVGVYDRRRSPIWPDRIRGWLRSPIFWIALLGIVLALVIRG